MVKKEAPWILSPVEATIKLAKTYRINCFETLDANRKPYNNQRSD